jgi:hypothetical protein
MTMVTTMTMISATSPHVVELGHVDLGARPVMHISYRGEKSGIHDGVQVDGKTVEEFRKDNVGGLPTTVLAVFKRAGSFHRAFLHARSVNSDGKPKRINDD